MTHMTLTAADARHLMRRAGYGALDADVQALTGLTRAAAVDHVLNLTGRIDGNQVPSVESRSSERRRLAHWWVEQMTSSPSPISERLFYFWHSHFACSSDRVRDQRNMKDQHFFIRQYGLGGFRSLLWKIAIGPAMLIDLDNASNVAGDEQENFARELLELYTIGNGRFTEDEVVSVARAWTGHNTEDGSKPPKYAFYSDRHDKHDKTLFGITKKWDAVDTIDELVDGVRRSWTADFVAWKLWREFGDASWWTEDLITDLANVMQASNMSAVDVVRAIFMRDEFWAPERRLAVIKQPLAWIVELQKRTGLRLSESQLDQRCAVLGQQLFLPPSVAGWGHNGAWLSAASLLARARVARDFASGVRDAGTFSGIADQSPADAATRILNFFGVPDASASTRTVVENWHIGLADETSSDSWFEREAFRVGALLPEVNLA